MAFGNGLGVEISVDNKICNIGSLLIESEEELESPYLKEIGKVIKEPVMKINSWQVEISLLRQSYEKTLESVFPSKTSNSGIWKEIPAEKEIQKTPVTRVNTIAKPKVVIPVFPGTNCEYESIKIFKKEGAEVTSVLINNLNLTKLNNSILTLEKELQNSQILMLPGGFSAGDEPDGSAKFMVSILKDERIKTAVHKLLERKGLILGICNGFQALVKSGLLPYGQIRDLETVSPTLTHNKIGRHVSQMVRIKVVSERSPWLKGMKGQTYVIPVSHGEGCFHAGEDEIKDLIKSDQIATQYVDFKGNPVMEMPFNPNGSTYAIEGLISKCGQIYGRMGHPERYTEGLMKNVPGSSYHNIFRNGLEHFKNLEYKNKESVYAESEFDKK
jgi:phosphoribosylformylglycinamidine synthase